MSQDSESDKLKRFMELLDERTAFDQQYSSVLRDYSRKRRRLDDEFIDLWSKVGPLLDKHRKKGGRCHAPGGCPRLAD